MAGKDTKKTENKISDTMEVSVSELAAVLGLSANRIYQMTTDGILQKTGRGRFCLADSVQRYVGFITKEPVTEDEQKMEKARRMAEVQLKASKAKIVGLEADELQGKMHRSEDVEAMVADLLYAVRGALIALPGRLAVDVAQADTAAEVSEIIRQEVNKVLSEIAQYKYDPLKYEERVRQRMDWDSIMGDPDDDS